MPRPHRPSPLSAPALPPPIGVRFDLNQISSNETLGNGWSLAPSSPTKRQPGLGALAFFTRSHFCSPTPAFSEDEAVRTQSHVTKELFFEKTTMKIRVWGFLKPFDVLGPFLREVGPFYCTSCCYFSELERQKWCPICVLRSSCPPIRALHI